MQCVAAICSLAALACVAAAAPPELKAAGVLIQPGTGGAVLSAGGSTIPIDKKGNITIGGAKDLNLKSGGAITVTAKTDVKVLAKRELKAEGQTKAQRHSERSEESSARPR
jgi:hypothetical protein